MSSVRDPVRKKQLAYERDHYAKGYHNDKLFRKAWPKIKRRMVRAGRHLGEEAVRHAKSEGDAVLPVRPKKKHELRKRYSPTLRQVVDAKTHRRRNSVGAKKSRRESRAATLLREVADRAAQEMKRAAREAEKKQPKKRPNPAPLPCR